MQLTLRLTARKSRLSTPLTATAAPWTSKSSFDLSKRAALLGVRLTAEEVQLLQRKAARLFQKSSFRRRSEQLSAEEFQISRRKFLRFARLQQDAEVEREAMLATIEKPDQASAWSKQLLPAIGIVGTMSWAVAGTQAAGEAGMHLIGCSLVGCISAMGGGTVNNLLFNDTRQGVNWVRNPRSTVMVALASSVVTFFAWPMICEALAEKRLLKIHETAASLSWTEWLNRLLGTVEEAKYISRNQFLAACKDPDFFNYFRKLLRPRMPGRTSPTAQEMFETIDVNHDGVIDLNELQNLVKLEYDGSSARYMLDTVAVGASSVTGTAGAIARGLHPVVCVVSSVTLCFGDCLLIHI